jgi:predicted ATP-grasp superfamily ATP-dependent carboligase
VSEASGPPSVLVTDAGLGSAVSVIRSLRRKGMRVIAADDDPYSPGFRSRYADERVRYPPPRSEPDALVETLLAVARERRVDLIVPVTDDTILPLIAARERFDGVSKLALPDAVNWARARDKEETRELARRLGVPTPRTALVATVAEARSEAARLGWPVVLKPQASRVYADGGSIEALSVTYAGGFARLAEHMRTFEGRCAVLLQEYYRGEAHGVELLLHEGRPLLAFQHRRLREVPITGGASSLRESVPLDPLLLDYAVRLLAELDWTGLAMVEFKVGEKGPQLMEINGRIWGSLPLAVKSGVDFPAGLADLYLNGPPDGDAPASSYRLGVRSRHLELEAVWIASVLRKKRRYPFLTVPRRRDALVAALRLLDPSDGYDILALDDPRPGLVEIVKILGKPFRRRADGR